MKYVWLVIDTESKKIIALYSSEAVAEKLAPVLAKKMKTIVQVQKRTVDLELEQVGTRP